MKTKNGFSQFISDCKEKKLVAFGASVFLQVIAMNYEELDLRNSIYYIVDNDSKKDGTRYSLLDTDKEVHSLEYLLNEELSNIVILISTDAYAYEIYRQLENIDKLKDTDCYCLPTMIETHEDDKNLHSLSGDKDRIPKIIHCFWFSGSPKDDLSKRCIESWRKFCPDYEIKEWNSENYNVKKNEYMYEAYKQRMWAYAADYARLDTVYNYGGFYFDMDLELTRNIDELLSADFVGGFGPIRDVELAAFGAKKNSPLVGMLLDSYKNRVFKGGEIPLAEVQPVLMDKLMKEYGFKINGKFQNIDNQILYPRYSFSPRNWFTGEMLDYEGSFGIHHCAGGWISKDKKKENHHENMKELSNIFGVNNSIA
jgi:hypothetical protein